MAGGHSLELCRSDSRARRGVNVTLRCHLMESSVILWWSIMLNYSNWFILVIVLWCLMISIYWCHSKSNSSSVFIVLHKLYLHCTNWVHHQFLGVAYIINEGVAYIISTLYWSMLLECIINSNLLQCGFHSIVMIHIRIWLTIDD